MDIITCLNCKNYSKNVKKRWVNNPHHVYDKVEKKLILVAGQFYYGCSGPEEMTIDLCRQFEPVKEVVLEGVGGDLPRLLVRETTSLTSKSKSALSDQALIRRRAVNCSPPSRRGGG